MSAVMTESAVTAVTRWTAMVCYVKIWVFNTTWNYQ